MIMRVNYIKNTFLSNSCYNVNKNPGEVFMKKILILIIASFLLTACGMLNEDTDTDVDNDRFEETEDEKETEEAEISDEAEKDNGDVDKDMLTTVYKVVEAAPAQQQMSELVTTLQKRLDDLLKNSSVKAQGTDQIMIEIPDTEAAKEELLSLMVRGELTITDEEGIIALTGEHIQDAAAEYDEGTDQHYVKIQFTEEGTDLFRKVTEQNVNKSLSIYLDDTLIQSANVIEPITGGVCHLTGISTAEEAERLATILRYGYLPYNLTAANE